MPGQLTMNPTAPSSFPRCLAMRTFRAFALRSSLVLMATLALSASAFAQGTTSGALRGRVVDEGGQPLASTTVTATNEATGLVRGSQTDDDGVYLIRLLPSGTYRVAARRIGQQPVEQAGIRVVVGSTTPLNFTLRTAAVTLTGVQIVAEAQPIDVAEAGVSQTVSQEEISNLPTLGRDFTDFISLSGLVSPDPAATTGGQFSIGGQRPSQTNIQIDGVDANNSFFGENRGGSRAPFSFSLESIREFQVITNAYDVEYGNYSGGVVNIITRGGTNDLKGSVYGNHRGSNLTANDFVGNPPLDFKVQQFAGVIEGPIVRDKLFFLGSADVQRRREPFRTVNPAFLRSVNDTAGAVALERFFAILDTVYNVENPAAGYNVFDTSDDVLTLFGRVDWTISPAHRFSIRNNFLKHDNLNEAFDFNGGISRAEGFRNTTNSLVSELTSVVRPNVYNVLRLQLAMESRPRSGNDLRPQLSVSIPGRTVSYGGNSIAFRNSLDEDKIQIVDNLTIDFGNHALKLGTNNTFAKFDNVFWNRGSGVYEFADLDRFEAGVPRQYTRSIRADRTAPGAKFNAQEYSLYAQDDWQVTPKLLASFGLRYDIARYGTSPGRVIDIERAFGLQTGTAPIDDDNISPRLSLTYDVFGDASNVFKIGGGLFYGRVPYVLGGNVASTDTPLLNLTCDGGPGLPTQPVSPLDYGDLSKNGNDNPFECVGGASVSGTPEYTFWDRNFELPETIKANIGYSRRLDLRTTATLDVLASESRKLYTVRNLNLRESQFALEAEGGRQVFVPEGSFTPNVAGGLDRLRNTDFSNVFVNYNDGYARSLAASIRLDRRITDSSAIQGSYTYLKAEDNSSYSCCTAFAGFENPRVGAQGPNVIGGIGATEAAWGPSDFVRTHTFVLSGYVRLPFAVRASGAWRLQSGRPWGPEQSGDLNGDGLRFNDRPYIYDPAELPVSVNPSSATPVAEQIALARSRYEDYLEEFECVGDYVGRIIPRNTCRQPWFNSLDLSLRRKFPTVDGQGIDLSIDLFNVLNGLNSDWGRNTEVGSAARNILEPQSYDAANDQILYSVPTTFGNERIVGINLVQQFSAQIGLRYSF